MRTSLHKGIIAGVALAAAVIAATPAAAAPEEIQVYMDEMSDPGQFGLDIHNNYVLTGDKTDTKTL